MVQDFFRTIKECFGWVFTILPIGFKMAFTLFGVAVFFFLLSLLFFEFLFILLCKISLILGCFVMFFFRNPERNTEFSENEITAPGDGTILSIKTEDDPNIVVIRIFLSIFNVHIQRAPISGTITNIKYTKGTFLFANNPSADKNERNLICFENGDKVMAIEQITGAIAKRIECWVEKEQKVSIGERVGLIRFGSQVAVYLPKDKVQLAVKVGQKVQGGISLIGFWSV